MNLDPDNSLIKRESEQPELFNSAEMDSALFKAEEDKGEFTGERLYNNHPEKYRAVLALLAEGLSVRAVCKALKVSHHTVLAVRQREASTIATLKERIATLAADGAKLCVEAIIERLFDDEALKKISARDLSIIAGVLIDKGQLLSGGVTSRVEVTGGEPGPDDFNRMLDKLAEAAGTGQDRERDKTKEQEPIDIDFSMVEDAEAPGSGAQDPEGPAQAADSASNTLSGAEEAETQ